MATKKARTAKIIIELSAHEREATSTALCGWRAAGTALGRAYLKLVSAYKEVYRAREGDYNPELLRKAVLDYAKRQIGLDDFDRRKFSRSWKLLELQPDTEKALKITESEVDKLVALPVNKLSKANARKLRADLAAGYWDKGKKRRSTVLKRYGLAPKTPPKKPDDKGPDENPDKKGPDKPSVEDKADELAKRGPDVSLDLDKQRVTLFDQVTELPNAARLWVVRNLLAMLDESEYLEVLRESLAKNTFGVDFRRRIAGLSLGAAGFSAQDISTTFSALDAAHQQRQNGSKRHTA